MIGGNAIEISRTSGFRLADGSACPAQVHDLLSAQELAALDVFDTIDDPIPDGKVPAGWTLEIGIGQVRRRFTGFNDPPVPAAITRYQFKAALLQANKATQAQTAIGSASADQKLAWSDAKNVRRDSDLVAYLKGALSLTDAQVDQFFRNAAAIAD